MTAFFPFCCFMTGCLNTKPASHFHALNIEHRCSIFDLIKFVHNFPVTENVDNRTECHDICLPRTNCQWKIKQKERNILCWNPRHQELPNRRLFPLSKAMPLKTSNSLEFCATSFSGHYMNSEVSSVARNLNMARNRPEILPEKTSDKWSYQHKTIIRCFCTCLRCI